jgi:hypothetical protein
METQIKKFAKLSVIPAQAGIHKNVDKNWIPACAGMTGYADFFYFLTLCNFHSHI